MSELDSTTAIGDQIQAMQSQIDALLLRVADLEATLAHEHEDLVALKEVSTEDHRKLESLKGGAEGKPSRPSFTPVGL
jgi:uncharacterized protein involved in exopolysaccharide biosynthesis